MQTNQPTEQPSPLYIFETLTAYQRSAALKGAIELDLFTAIAEGVDTSEALAARCQTAPKGMRVLCDYLTVFGFLTKTDDRYSLTLDAATFLNRHSPAYMGVATIFLQSPTLMQAYADVAAAVRKGGAAFSEEGTMEADHPVWVEFARAMAPLMAMPADLIGKLIDAENMASCKVLDIAAGHGMFGIALARQNPAAEITAVDWAHVLAVASDNADKAGVASRYHTLPGSAFDVEFGDGYDVVLLTNFLHHFDPATNETLLRKVHAALKPGGRAVTFEFVPNDDRVSPPVPAAFAMTMLISTTAGDAYTFAEYDQMFTNAGFAKTEMHQLPPSMQQVLVSTK